MLRDISAKRPFEVRPPLRLRTLVGFTTPVVVVAREQQERADPERNRRGDEERLRRTRVDHPEHRRGRDERKRDGDKDPADDAPVRADGNRPHACCDADCRNENCSDRDVDE